VGKSTLVIDLAARESRGDPFPGSRRRRAPGRVLLISAEDDMATTIVPRLQAHGADMKRVHLPGSDTNTGGNERPVELPRDVAEIQRIVVENEITFVVIDPLVAFLSRSVHSHSDQDVRRVLSALTRMAQRTGAAVLCVRHLTKATSAGRMYRGGGSIGIIASVRTAMLVAPDPTRPGQIVVAALKSNIGPLAESLVFTMNPRTNGQTAIEWLGTTRLIAEQLGKGGGISRGPTKEEQALTMLQALLVKPRRVTEIKIKAKARGIGWRTVEQAKHIIGVISEQKPEPGQKGRGPSWWRMP
jgi:hypothetical protein